MPTVALSLAAPWMAGWLALAGLPILIHLLHRQRHKMVPWAAMRWLLAAVKKNQRWLRLEQWLLLALRTLIIALAVLAMMKPAMEQVGALFSLAGPSTHHILVVDNSMSMQYDEGSIPRFERAKAMATEILDSARQGDFASVVVLSSPTTTLVGEASPYLISVAEEIESVGPRDGHARIEDAIEPVTRILKNSPASRRQVYFITDMQRSAWFADDRESDPADFARRLQTISEEAAVFLFDVSGAESPNIALTDIEQIDPLAVLGRPTVFRVTVANFGSADRDDLRLELRVEGEIESAQPITVPAGQRKSFSLPVVFDEAGDRSVEVRVSGDSLSVDNSRWWVARVRESLNVLAIDGRPSSEPFQSETDYLRIAFSPAREDGTYDLIRVDSRGEADLLEEKLDDWDLIVIANVGQITENEARSLASFVRRGGGLLFFLGSEVDLAGYTRVLHDEASGLLPAQLVEVRGAEAPADAPFVFDPLEYQHPLVADFRDNEQAGLLTTRIAKYVRAVLPEGTTAKVALAFDSGDPAVIVSSYGNGMVGVVTTSANLKWNSWPISPSYVPLVQQLAQLLVAGRVRRDDVRVGESFSLALPEETFEIEASVIPPKPRAIGIERKQQASQVVRSEMRESIGYLSYSDTDLAGIYQAVLGQPIQQVWGVAVNPWAQESDLTKLSERDLRAALPGWEFRLLDRWESDEPIAAQSGRDSGFLHRPILYLVLGFVFLETVLAWKFGHSN